MPILREEKWILVRLNLQIDMEKFMNLVNSYLIAVESSLAMLQEYSLANNGYETIRKGNLNEDKSLYFCFHGAGCLFVNNGLKIDFEMPIFRESIIYVELYFLIDFWESNIQKFGYVTSEEIENDFQLAKNKKEFKEHPFRRNQISTSFTKKYNLFSS